MNTGRIFISVLSVVVPTLRTIMNSSYYYEYRENIHLGVNLALTLHQTAHVWELEKSLNCTRLTKVEKQVETKIIQCIEMGLTKLMKAEKKGETKTIQCIEVALYQTLKSRMKTKWFTEDSYLVLYVYFSRLRLSPSL